MSEKKKVIIGMSGGVDSSVSAYLLKEQGYEVVGITMDMHENISENAYVDAHEIAQQLGIEHYLVDFTDDFKTHVVDTFIDNYLEGITPNPCVECNKFIKWNALFNEAKKIGAEYIATGHYAKIIQLENGRYTIQTAESSAKDQSYVLYNMSQEQLAHCIMPCGAYSKDEIRAIAEKIGLKVANKSESMEICFIPDNDYVGFICKNRDLNIEEGNFVDNDGNILGKHKGIINYTIGQRKGLGIAFGKPLFVVAIKPKTNEVVLGDNDQVFSKTLIAKNINLLSVSKIEDTLNVTAKIRYKHEASPCTIRQLDDDTILCEFEKPQRAVTPGQSVVFYNDDIVVGGGTIV